MSFKKLQELQQNEAVSHAQRLLSSISLISLKMSLQVRIDLITLVRHFNNLNKFIIRDIDLSDQRIFD